MDVNLDAMIAEAMAPQPDAMLPQNAFAGPPAFPLAQAPLDYVQPALRASLANRDRRCARAVGADSMRVAISRFSPASHVQADFFGERERCTEELCKQFGCQHIHSHFHGTDDARRRVYPTLFWKTHMGPDFPVTDAFDKATWRCMEGCELGIGSSGHRRQRSVKPCLNPHHYQLVRTSATNGTLLKALQELLLETGLSQMPQLAPFVTFDPEVDPGSSLDALLSVMCRLFAETPVAFQAQPAVPIGDFVNAPASPPLPPASSAGGWPPQVDGFAGDDLPNSAIDTMQLGQLLGDMDVDQDYANFKFVDEDLLHDFGDLIQPSLLASCPGSKQSQLGDEPMVGTLLPPDTATDSETDSEPDLHTQFPNDSFSGVIFACCSNPACHRSRVITMLQPGSNYQVCSECNLPLEASSPLESGHAALTPKADYAYAVEREVEERVYTEGDVVGWFPKKRHDGSTGFVVKLLSSDNHDEAFLAAVISRSAFLVANSGASNNAMPDLRRADMICMLGFVLVNVEGPAAVGHALYTNPQATVPGVAIAVDPDGQPPEGAIRLGTVLELADLDDLNASADDPCRSTLPDGVTCVRAFVSPLGGLARGGIQKQLQEQMAGMVKREVAAQVESLRRTVETHDRHIGSHDRRIAALEGAIADLSLTPNEHGKGRGRRRGRDTVEATVPAGAGRTQSPNTDVVPGHDIDLPEDTVVALYHPHSQRFVSVTVNKCGEALVKTFRRLAPRKSLFRTQIMGAGRRIRFASLNAKVGGALSNNTAKRGANNQEPLLGLAQGGLATLAARPRQGTFRLSHFADGSVALTRVNTCSMLAFDQAGRAVSCTDPSSPQCRFHIQPQQDDKDSDSQSDDGSQTVSRGAGSNSSDEPTSPSKVDVKEAASNGQGRQGMRMICVVDAASGKPIVVGGRKIGNRQLPGLRGPEFAVCYVSSGAENAAVGFDTFVIPRGGETTPWVASANDAGAYRRLDTAVVIPRPAEAAKSVPSSPS